MPPVFETGFPCQVRDNAGGSGDGLKKATKAATLRWLRRLAEGTSWTDASKPGPRQLKAVFRHRSPSPVLPVEWWRERDQTLSLSARLNGQRRRLSRLHDALCALEQRERRGRVRTVAVFTTCFVLRIKKSQACKRLAHRTRLNRDRQHREIHMRVSQEKSGPGYIFHYLIFITVQKYGSPKQKGGSPSSASLA